MREVLDMLTQEPGVKQAAVISGDGVPVCVLERGSFTHGEFVESTTSNEATLEGQRIDPASLVALAAAFVDDVVRAVGQLAWELPRRITLRSSQGTLIVQQGPHSHVMVVVDPGLAPELFTLPLESAVERLNRLLRDLGRFDPDQSAAALPSGASVKAAPTIDPPSIADYARGALGDMDDELLDSDPTPRAGGGA